jgi:REP element-mobilizing transposase RayT
MRKVPLIIGEYFHIFNRGVDKRPIVHDDEDSGRFMQSLLEFNTIEPIGSIYENSFIRREMPPKNPLVSFVAYCLNPNHYHFILTSKVENGIQQFMQRFGTGYSLYFNNKYKRCGPLFQGKFKSSHINSNEYLLHVSAYVNLNNRVHQLGSRTSKLVRSSFDEYLSTPSPISIPLPKDEEKICDKKIILEQFRSSKEYVEFALSSLEDMVRKKADDEELAKMLFE